MERDALFLSTLDDVKGLINTEDEFQALRLAAHLRKLLVDERPLVHEVNRSRRVRLRFHVRSPDPEYAPERTILRIVGSSLVPTPSSPSEELNLDRFLGRQVMVAWRRRYTVADVIKHVANVSGGVHAGEPKSRAELHLEIADRLVEHGGLPAAAGQVRAIAQVVLIAMEPLKAAILQEQCKYDRLRR